MKTKDILRRALRGAGAALLALALGLAPAARADTTLRFISWQVDEKGAGDWLREAIEEYESAHPGVKIEFTKVSRNEYVDTMIALFAGGDAPEIVHLASFEYSTFADNGWLEDLAPYIAESGLDLTGWAGQEKCAWKGVTYCVMLLYFGAIMGYNEKMLQDAGVALPTTYNEFLEAARKLTRDTDGDGIIDQYGTAHHTVKGNQYLTEMLTYVLDAGGYWSDDQGRPAMNTPEMIEGLRRWKTIVREDLTPRDLPAGDVRQMFKEGKVAMLEDGPWIYPIMQQADPEIRRHLKVAAPPFHPPVGGTSNILAINAAIPEEQKQLVWEFILLVASEKYQRLYSELSTMPAPRPGAFTPAVKDKVPHFDLLVQTMTEANRAGVDRIPKGLEAVYNEFAKMVIEESQRMILEDSDPAAAAARMQERALQIQARQ